MSIKCVKLCSCNITPTELIIKCKKIDGQTGRASDITPEINMIWSSQAAIFQIIFISVIMNYLIIHFHYNCYYYC